MPRRRQDGWKEAGLPAPFAALTNQVDDLVGRKVEVNALNVQRGTHRGFGPAAVARAACSVGSARRVLPRVLRRLFGLLQRLGHSYPRLHASWATGDRAASEAGPMASQRQLPLTTAMYGVCLSGLA